MKKTKEKQITSYEQLVRICESIGARYNPGKEAIKPAALSSLLEQAQQAIKVVTVAQQANTSAISVRNEVHAGIPKLATRIFHAMAASDAPQSTLEDAMQIRRTLAYRAPKRKTKLPEGQVQELKPSGNPAAQLNYEAVASNFGRLVECVKGMSDYATNEPDLTIDALERYREKLALSTAEVIRTNAIVMNARFNREQLLYSTVGIFGVSKSVKHYMRSAFAHNSDEIRKVNGIMITKR